MIELDEEAEETQKWLAMLVVPGSSLGGARPKANVTDETGQPWIAKFPSKNDIVDKAAWEYLAYRLAIRAGVVMAECRLEAIAGRYRTFFTKRFDREKRGRIHFASAMTMTGKTEELIRDDTPSYLEVAEFIQFSGTRVVEDLHQLWRRIVFNIAISNTDDHLRNHGFVLTPAGWRLSPAFDINPSVDRDGLALNIDMENNWLDYGLAESVGTFFRLDKKEMENILHEIKKAVTEWRKLAGEIGIPRSEQELMEPAFGI
jgi:serine/threonine-protein kinase HipA